MWLLVDAICRKALGQPGDVVRNQALALFLNIFSWLNSISPLRLLPPAPPAPEDPRAQAVSIAGPGGLDRLTAVSLGSCATVGYNVKDFCPPPFTPPLPTSAEERTKALPPQCVLVRVHYFSVNYADVTIRWGLYESALRYVGWPIVPGFDLGGVVEWAGGESGWKEGDRVFGFTMFGAYSTLCLVPGRQLMRVPLRLCGQVMERMPLREAAAAPAVAATALHAVALAGFWPEAPPQRCRAALVHSAAGGVGSMLLQVCRLCGFSPIVAVVGSGHKAAACRDLGADVVIDKSSEDLWVAARKASPEAVLGFNLSFFAEEHDLIEKYMRQLSDWLEAGELRVSKVTELPMDRLQEAHALLQSGRSVGKLVLRTPAAAAAEEG